MLLYFLTCPYPCCPCCIRSYSQCIGNCVRMWNLQATWIVLMGNSELSAALRIHMASSLSNFPFTWSTRYAKCGTNALHDLYVRRCRNVEPAPNAIYSVMNCPRKRPYGEASGWVLRKNFLGRVRSDTYGWSRTRESNELRLEEDIAVDLQICA